MSYVKLKEKTVVCRLHHYCEWCGKPVLKGEKSLYRAYIFDGDFNAGYQHLECYAALHRYINQSYDGRFDIGSMERGKTPSESDEFEL